MSEVKLVWATPDIQNVTAYVARVSNPSNQANTLTAPKLLQYLIKHKHFSPFEMSNVCMQIDTTRDIGRQILRHRSFSFQEFSQRYADISALQEPAPRECRLQDDKDRQNSLANENEELALWWAAAQRRVQDDTHTLYHRALERGIAKEQARALLPEGLTPSRMYMNGTLRSWLHYIQVRSDPSTQKEHREIALQCAKVLEDLGINFTY